MIHFRLRQTALALVLLLGVASATAKTSISDSLQSALALEVNPQKRVDILLNLKDLKEDTPLNIPYSIQLFREATTLQDTYAMSVAIEPIIANYATYQEKNDSLSRYVRALRRLAPGTPEEGITYFAEMAIGYFRMRDEYDSNKRLAMAKKTIQWSDSLASAPTIYEQTKWLFLRGYAEVIIANAKQEGIRAYPAQIDTWERAYTLTHQMPNINIQKAYANMIFYVLSYAYNEAQNFEDQVKLISDYLALLDNCYAADMKHRRPYLYHYNGYVMPYQQLICGAINISRNDLAHKYFQEFRERMLDAEPADIARNTNHIYEIGYLLHGTMQDNETSLKYCDSLLLLVDDNTKNFAPTPEQILRINHDRSQLLYLAGHYAESFEAFERTSQLQDSLYKAERQERTTTIQLSHDMDRLKLAETHAKIRNRLIAITSFLAIGLLLIGLSIYQYLMLRHNRQVQADILRHSRKAEESEHMKSTFVNSICGGIGPPLNAICNSATKLMTAGPQATESHVYLEEIHTNTKHLLSTLDNMLEAANLDSLTDNLQLQEVNIDELCRAELLSASRLHTDSGVEYRIEAPEAGCEVCTHAKYFSFVIRALLDNAIKFTHQGSVTLNYETSEQTLRVTITDTGCGISPERRQNIFRPLHEHIVASSGLSLSLCRVIAERLAGTICLDEEYTQGARFIFTIPHKL